MTHDIDENTKNSNIIYCIDEYVRIIKHRQILKEKWFDGMTISELSAKYNYSETTIKDILRDIGKPILKKASKM